MDKQRTLYRECINLCYTQKKVMSDEVFEKTMSELKKIWEKYGYADTLGTLAGIWKHEEAVPFLNRMADSLKQYVGLKQRDCSEIHTVATFYHRAYMGGVERANAELMNIWNKMGVKVIFFTLEPENSMDYDYPKCVKRIIIPNGDAKSRFRALQEYCIREKVDLFVNHEWTDPNYIWDCILLKIIGVKYLQYCHGHFSWSLNGGRGSIYHVESFKLPDMILAISEVNARFYQMFGFDTYLVRNPIPSDLLNCSYSSKVDSKRVLFAGRLSFEKYPMEALQIFEKVHEKINDIVLDVVGDGDPADEMMKFVKQHNLEDCVIFHGEKNSTELAQFYKNASCVLFTSKMEGYPMMLLETKAYGLPVVMYDLNYLTLVKDRKGILTAPIGDVEKMSEQLFKLMSDYNYRKKKSDEASESFEYFKSHDYTSEWNSIFNIVINKNRCIENHNYHKGCAEQEVDGMILPQIFERLKDGYRAEVENTLEYKAGIKILMIPRMLVRTIRKIRQRLL